MENEKLVNVLCHVKPKYRTAIQGDLCCIREINDQEAKIDIIECSGFRKCTVPLECIKIPDNPRTISEICTEIFRCMTRYLAAERPDFLQTEDAQLMQQFLRAWM